MNAELWWTVLTVAIAVVLLAIDVVVLYFLARGAPYVPTKPEAVEIMLAMIDVRPGMKAVDIGSGDGRIVIAMAKRGIEAHGYEINPVLVWISRRNIKRAGLEHLAKIYRKDLWNANFSHYDIVTLFGVSYIMKRLEKKLQSELKPGAQVVSMGFAFPSWPPSDKRGNIFLYRR